jgi:dTDP-4-amino-4,6-dideoxygalactose transaminase
LQAAILRVKLKSLAASNARRRELAALYAKGLAGLPVHLPTVRPGCEHVYHLYVIRTAKRDALMKHLLDAGIPAALHYPAAVHQQPAYDHVTRSSLPLPHTDTLVPEILSLPLHPHLPDAAVQATCDSIRAFFQ